jgi:1,4-dihydroxy-2-naphthoyl-CoA hydrolase
MIWKHKISIDFFNDFSKNTLVENLGIEFIEAGDDFLKATMPVDNRTKQPLGLLHGGASVALAETLGSVASTACVDDPTKQQVVGVEINANHMKAVKTGLVTGTVKPIKIGKRIHVWNIDINDEEGNICCISRLTTMIISR